MSTVEEFEDLLQRLRLQHVELDNPFIGRLERAYKTVGSTVIKGIAAAYKKIGETKRNYGVNLTKDMPIQSLYTMPDGNTKPVIFIMDDIKTEVMQEILRKEYGVAEEHAKIIDSFMRRVWLGEEARPYEEVLREFGVFREEPEMFYGGEIRKSDRR